MSVTAFKLDDVYLGDVQTQTETRTVTEGDESHLEWRDHWTIYLTRKFVGMSAFYPENRQIKTFFSFKTGGGMQCTWSSPGRKFFCTADNPQVTDSITGEGVENQTWESYTKWERIPETSISVISGGT